jgi:hypothetical protein
MEAVAAPPPEANPNMPDQIIDAVMARAIHADAVRTHPPAGETAAGPMDTLIETPGLVDTRRLRQRHLVLLFGPVRRGGEDRSMSATLRPSPLRGISPGSGEDAPLIFLGRLLDDAVAQGNEAWAANDCYGTAETNDLAQIAFRRTSAIVDRIEALQATTLEGLQVKFRAIVWCFGEDAITVENLTEDLHPTTDIRLIAGLLQDMQRMGRSSA